MGRQLVSLRPEAFPRITSETRAFRATIDVKASGRTVPFVAEVVLVGRGRTEISMSVFAPLAADRAVQAAEIHFTRLLASRAQP